MKNAYKKLASILAILVVGLTLAGCDKSSSTVIPPEEVKPSVPAEPKVEPKTEAPIEPKIEPKPVVPVADDPNAFVSTKGGFKITLPDGFPDFVLTEGACADPSDIALTYVAEKHGQAGCLVMVNSSAGWAKAEPKAALDSVRDNNVSANSENAFEKEEDFSLNGFPGRRVFIKQQSGAVTYFVRYDIILVKDRLYQIMYLTNQKSELASPKIKAYFDSFKLID